MKTKTWLETYFCKDCDATFYVAWSEYGAEQLNECPCCGNPGRRIDELYREEGEDR